MNSDDDDDRGFGDSRTAGFDPSGDMQLDLALNNDERLNMKGVDRRVWLVKVPKFLLEKWQNTQQDGQELGRLRVYRKPLPNGDDRIALLIPPSRPGEEEIPTEYAMTIQNKATKNTLIFAERDDVTHGESGWEPGKGRVKPHETGIAAKRPAKKRMPTITGTVHHECNLTPRVDSESYRKIVRSRQAKAAEPKRKLQVLNDDKTEQSRLGIAGMAGKKYDILLKQSAKPKVSTNRILPRLPRNEVLDLLFGAFETHDYWSLKNLRAHTQQPDAYLRELLADIAQLNLRGPYMGLYSLLETYKARGKGEGKMESDSNGATASSSGVKREEGDEDVKPKLDEVADNDDVDMDAIL